MNQEAPNRFATRKADAADPLVGSVVNGRFRISRVVAIGGMGRIYEAEQLPLGRRVALKVLHSQFTQSSDDEAFKKRFFLEASILSKLQHANIVTVFDYGRIEGVEEAYYMVMEFLPGETLHARLERQRTLSAGESINLARQLARGLREAHRHDVVHRDLKPSNVMILPQEDGSELVKVVDFGLVKVLTDDSDHVTKDGTFLGSPRYMSPEQIAHGKVDHRTDIYSLGVIMYQCLCGAVPFDSDHAVQTLMAHLNNAVPPMKERVAGCEVPQLLEDYVRRCLSKSPDERPASMDAIVRDLADLQQALGLGPPVSGPSGVTRYELDTGPMNRSDLATTPMTGSTGRLRLVTPEGAGNTVQPVADPTLATASSGPQRRRWLPVALVGAGLLLTAVAAGAVVLATSARSAGNSPSADATPSVPATFVLTIDSTPSDAEVLEGSKVLGRTPLQLTIDNQAAAREPRRLILQASGYQPFPIVQGSSDQNLRVAAALVAAPTSTASAEPPTTATGAATPAVTTRTPTRVPTSPGTTKKNETKPPDSDIRLNR